uniref:Ig-like domain-containing protein n=1 Tax=Poecilia latipinna TaxID=48699 RepID=A0A3B3TSN1_9TELE
MKKFTFFLCSGVICQLVTPVKDERSGSVDSLVSLSCNYSKGAADYFFWYRQHPGKPPEFLTFNTEVEETQKESQSKFSGRVRKTETRMDLLISSAAVTDSAVYYCAVRPTVTGNTRTLYKNLQYSTAATRGPHSLLILWLLKGQKDNLSHSAVTTRQYLTMLTFTGTNILLTFRLLSFYS